MERLAFASEEEDELEAMAVAEDSQMLKREKWDRQYARLYVFILHVPKTKKCIQSVAKMGSCRSVGPRLDTASKTYVGTLNETLKRFLSTFSFSS